MTPAELLKRTPMQIIKMGDGQNTSHIASWLKFMEDHLPNVRCNHTELDYLLNNKFDNRLMIKVYSDDAYSCIGVLFDAYRPVMIIHNIITDWTCKSWIIDDALYKSLTNELNDLLALSYYNMDVDIPELML